MSRSRRSLGQRDDAQEEARANKSKEDPEDASVRVEEWIGA